MNQEILLYFQSHNLRVDWDRCGGKKYYEIYSGRELLVQFDFGVTLDDLIKDFKYHKYEEGEQSNFDYLISGPEDKFRKLLEILPI